MLAIAWFLFVVGTLLHARCVFVLGRTVCGFGMTGSGLDAALLFQFIHLLWSTVVSFFVVVVLKYFIIIIFV